jgi:hypothetical protein
MTLPTTAVPPKPARTATHLQLGVLLRVVCVRPRTQHELQEGERPCAHEPLRARQHGCVKLLRGQAPQPLQHVAARAGRTWQGSCQLAGARVHAAAHPHVFAEMPPHQAQARTPRAHARAQAHVLMTRV